MTRSRKPRLPHINNSGQYRLPNNVRIVVPEYPNDPFDPKFYEHELQDIAESHPDWIVFVLEVRWPRDGERLVDNE